MLRFIAMMAAAGIVAARGNSNVNGPCTITALPPFVGSVCDSFQHCMGSIQLAPQERTNDQTIVSLTMGNATCMVTPTPRVNFWNLAYEARVETRFQYTAERTAAIKVQNTPNNPYVTIIAEGYNPRGPDRYPTCTVNATVTSGACMFLEAAPQPSAAPSPDATPAPSPSEASAAPTSQVPSASATPSPQQPSTAPSAASAVATPPGTVALLAAAAAAVAALVLA